MILFMLEMNEQVVEDVTILSFTGDFDTPMRAAEFLLAIKNLIKAQRNKIIANFKNVGFVDSDCLQALICARTNMENAGGELRLCVLPKRLSDILQYTKQYTSFKVYDDEKKALNDPWE